MLHRIRTAIGALLLAMALAGCAVVRDIRTGEIYDIDLFWDGPVRPYEQILGVYDPDTGRPLPAYYARLFEPRWIGELGGVFTTGNMHHPFGPAATDAWGSGVIAGIGAETGCYSYFPGTDICLRLGGYVTVQYVGAESPPNFGLEISKFRVPFIASTRATAYVPVPNTSLQIFGGVGPAIGYREGTFGGERDSGWSWGWQVTGGLEYPTSPNSKVRLAYTFTDLRPLAYDFAGARVKVDTDIHALTVGYTRAFGSGLAFEGFNAKPNIYYSGTPRWIIGADVSWARTESSGPGFSPDSTGFSAGVFGGYHRALGEGANGIVPWMRIETGVTFTDSNTSEPGVYHGNIGPTFSFTPGVSWQFLGTPTRPDICFFLLGGIAGARIQDHVAGNTVSKFNAAFIAIAGFEFGLSKDWATRISYSYTDFGSIDVGGVKIDHRVDRVSVGLVYRPVMEGRR